MSKQTILNPLRRAVLCATLALAALVPAACKKDGASSGSSTGRVIDDIG